MASTSDDSALQTATPKKEHSFKRSADRYVPPCISTRYADPFLALTHFFDTVIAAGAMPTASATATTTSEQNEKKNAATVSSNKKNSLRRIASFRTRNGEATGNERTARLGECVAEISKKLAMRVDAFVAFVVRITRLRDSQQILDLTTIASYLLLDRTVTQHAELKALKLCDNSLVHAIGVCETRKQILKDSLADACGFKRATERCNEVIQFADRWLLEACDSNVETIAALLPVVWLWDNETLEPLTAKELENNYLRCRLDLPFLIVGVLDVLQLHAERDSIILDVYQTFI